MDLYYTLCSTVQIFPRMPNEYFIHVIYLLILTTETIFSLYGINNFRN